MQRFDVAVIGSGMAGASAAYELAGGARVLVVEREGQHGYHTTGRSAALYSAAYGGPEIRALTLASRAFFDAPPAGFSDYPLLGARGCLYLAAPGQEAALAARAEAVSRTGVAVRTVCAGEAVRRAPILKRAATIGAVFEPDACDVDVNALHMGFLRGAQARGAQVRLNAGVRDLARAPGGWRLALDDGETAFAEVVVNAAGAWADPVAEMAGARPAGLTPLRRTALLVDPPGGAEVAAWPAVIDIAETWYFKPDAGRILASPADETPSPPCDAAPEELDIAICIDRIQQAAELPVRRVARAWAGLRTFAPDRRPVIGYDPFCKGLFWLAGQGGYGVQSAPAAARLAAALVRGEPAPADITARGLDPAQLSPARFMAEAARA